MTSQTLFVIKVRLLLFFNFLLILCRVHIMYPNPTHLPFPSYLPSTLETSPGPSHLTKTEENKSHCGSCSISYTVSQYIPVSTHLHLQMFTAMSHWSSLRPPTTATSSILDHHQDSSQTSCCCPASWRSCSSGSTGLNP